MNGRVRAAAVLWNEEPDRFVFLLEELCTEMRESGLDMPVVVDCRDQAQPPHFLLRDNRDAGIRGLKGIAQGHIPYILPSEFHLLKKGSVPPEQYLYLLLTDEGALEKTCRHVDDVLFVATPGPDSVSATFRYLQRYRYTQDRYPRFHVVVAGEARIEDAAEAFMTVRNEVLNISRNQADFLFCGSYCIDFEKVGIVRSMKAAYRDIFKGDSLYGQLLYTGRNLASRIETIEMDAGIEAFFEALSSKN